MDSVHIRLSEIIAKTEEISKHGRHNQATHASKSPRRGGGAAAKPKGAKSKGKAKVKATPKKPKVKPAKKKAAPKKGKKKVSAAEQKRREKARAEKKAEKKASFEDVVAKSGQKKTYITPDGARQQAKAQKVAEYMMPAAQRMKDPAVRRYMTARIGQMTGGTPRPDGMSKKYGLDKADVPKLESLLSNIFVSGRIQVGI